MQTKKIAIFSVYFYIVSLMRDHPFFVAAFLGALTGLAFAPFFITSVFVLSYGGLVYVLRETNNTDRHFIMGSVFFLGLMGANFFWTVNLTSEYFFSIWPEDRWKVYSVSFSALVLFFLPSTILYGVCAVALAKLDRSSLCAIAKPWFMALLLLGAEMLIGLPYKNGFPWYVTGYSVADDLYLSQVSAFGSVYLISFILMGISLSVVMYMGRQHIITLSVLGVWVAGGVVSLSFVNVPYNNKDPIYLRLVQAGLPVDQMMSESKKIQKFLFYDVLSYYDGEQDSLLIWPEMSVPFFIQENPGHIERLMEHAKPEIIVGGLHRSASGNVKKQTETQKSENVYNVSVLVKSSGDVEYVSKSILVPFGEYFPLEKYLAPVYERFLSHQTVFSVDQNDGILESDYSGKIGILNCYEGLFSGVAAQRALGADFLLQIGNDAWVDQTWAQEQMLYIARMRAIETRRPVVRSVNKGIMAVIDPYGRFIFVNDDDTPDMYFVALPRYERHNTIWTKAHHFLRTKFYKNS